MKLGWKLELAACWILSIGLIDSAAQETEAQSAKTNKLRYATIRDPSASNRADSLRLDQIMQLETSNPKLASESPYLASVRSPFGKFAKRDDTTQEEGATLDDEDISLLDKFYRDTKQNDPFESSLSIDDLWREMQVHDVGSLDALMDRPSPDQETHGVKHDQQPSVRPQQTAQNDAGWTMDPDLAFRNEMFKLDEMLKGGMQNQLGPTDDEHKLNQSHGQEEEPEREPEFDPQQQAEEAAYSPTLRLLTSYDPLRSIVIGYKHPMRGDRSVGATLFGQDAKDNFKPKVSSKSATVALKLHDEMMKSPPKDGKVRVRMYHHRAIHDDTRLYGTGPWKYWSHGWGLEFGYDPKDVKDSYQRGYTVERAFGRDFCEKASKCRKSDLSFFSSIHDAGKYSEQHFRPHKVNSNRI